jgi:hypothetical protein
LRKWTTSSRGKKETVIVEDVYEVLCLPLAKQYYDHRFIPPSPFFASRNTIIRELEEELVSGDDKIVFLSGLPGIGKTSIVSELANKRDSVIDIRYYAYKPIDPKTEYLPLDVSERTKADVFWGEILSQIRQLFKGKLSKYNVPIRNDFLTLEELRKKALYFADKYGELRGKKTIIAIDGIDHAARSNIDAHTFLTTLFEPNSIPQNVKFFIIGQPIECYDKYPWWLKQKIKGISFKEVNRIEREDIEQLIKNTKGICVQDNDLNTLVRLIESISKGNTLAAIFAVNESLGCNNVLDVKMKLEKNRLSNNLNEYYNCIWSNATSKLEKYSPFISIKLAGCLALINERLTGEILSEIFLDSRISSSDWEDVLEYLQPIIIKENEAYRILHNDVSVFLNGVIQGKGNKYKEVAGCLADYYKTKSTNRELILRDLFRFLEISNREKELVEIFTPEYVLEWYALKLSL